MIPDPALPGRIARLLLALLSAATPAAAADRTAPVKVVWPAGWFNPKPTAEDLVLPMPCGGGMVFRRIDTASAEAWLADQPVRLGQSDPATLAVEDLRNGTIAGGFTRRGKPDQRFYYLAKYELTQAQWDAVMEERCQGEALRPGNAVGGVAKDHVGWLDAIEFSRRYQEWLLANARDSLPTEDGSPGFVRLPTEVEWEFAARGGTAVLPAQWSQRLPFEGGVDQYAWTASTCNGETQFIGTLRPNPLGLHDMLGNVAELTLEPFHATAPGRLHGQVGGAVVRGGSCLTSDDQLRSADRREEPWFDAKTGKRRQPPFTGFRLGLGAPLVTSQKRLEAYRGSYETVAAARTSGLTGRDPVADARALAKAVDATQPGLSRDLNQLASTIGAELARRGEIEASAARSMILSAGVLMRGYRQEVAEIRGLEQAIAALGSPTGRPQIEERLDRLRKRSRLTGRAYLSLLVEGSNDLGPDLLQAQLPQVESSLSAEESPIVVKLARRFVEHSRIYRTRPPAQLDSLLTDILKVE